MNAFRAPSAILALSVATLAACGPCKTEVDGVFIDICPATLGGAEESGGDSTNSDESSTTDPTTTTTSAASDDASSGGGSEGGDAICAGAAPPLPGQPWGACKAGNACDKALDGGPLFCLPSDTGSLCAPACGGDGCPVTCDGECDDAGACRPACESAADCPYPGMVCGTVGPASTCLWPT